MPGPGGEVSCAEVNACSVPTAGRTATGLTQSDKPAAVQLMESCDCGVVRTTARETLCVIAGRGVATLTSLLAARSLIWTAVFAPTVNCGRIGIRRASPFGEKLMNRPIAQ